MSGVDVSLRFAVVSHLGNPLEVVYYRDELRDEDENPVRMEQNEASCGNGKGSLGSNVVESGNYPHFNWN